MRSRRRYPWSSTRHFHSEQPNKELRIGFLLRAPTSDTFTQKNIWKHPQVSHWVFIIFAHPSFNFNLQKTFHSFTSRNFSIHQRWPCTLCNFINCHCNTFEIQFKIRNWRDKFNAIFNFISWPLVATFRFCFTTCILFIPFDRIRYD